MSLGPIAKQPQGVEDHNEGYALVGDDGADPYHPCQRRQDQQAYG